MKPVPISAWKTTPRSSIVIFMVAVFFVFANIGFVSDMMDMGRQPPIRFALSVVLSGLFAVCYAIAGISLRGRFWIATIPIFIVHFTLMGLLGNWFPDGPWPAHYGSDEIGHLHNRLNFSGLSVILSICLSYAGFVYVSISEGRRHGRAQGEKALLEGEMIAAREVQRVMVPEDLPSIRGYSLESVYRPASEVGGDFFQVVLLKSGRTLVVMGDVSGKGLRAAMIVSMIVGTLHTASGFTEEPSDLLAELNRRLCGRMGDGFATCLVVRLEEQGNLTLSNAGHLPPYRNGIEIDLPGSLPLGLEPNTVYEQSGFSMAPGDGLVLLTDGIAEAQNPQRVLLGFTTVESMLREGATAHTVADRAQQYGQNDDITAIRIVREGSSRAGMSVAWSVS